ncbi:MAG: RrF2 family transcriptional regulator [Eubacteriaceae bacterium]
MKISTRGKYALEAILDLALITKDTKLDAIKNIAERRNISKSYLEQIFVVLKKKDILISVRGNNGGFMLAKSASKTTVGEILRAVEGNLAPVFCVDESQDNECSRNKQCPTRSIWKRIMNEINATTDSISIQDLLDSVTTNND